MRQGKLFFSVLVLELERSAIDLQMILMMTARLKRRLLVK